ncbi:hypothetical protein [Actinoalloteichus spitiensis]|uniref:hypothetical protein n=1 Tax=Actinoalloteichus spitiensis TaxID=252394 RepID=UPI00037F7FDA|nr:hypothetical protein [Actinoalloteichus spitiensis]
MDHRTASTCGDAMAPVFDFPNSDEDETGEIVRFLTSLGTEGPEPEPDVGTGGVVIPLARTPAGRRTESG